MRFYLCIRNIYKKKIATKFLIPSTLCVNSLSIDIRLSRLIRISRYQRNCILCALVQYYSHCNYRSLNQFRYLLVRYKSRHTIQATAPLSNVHFTKVARARIAIQKCKRFKILRRVASAPGRIVRTVLDYKTF